MEKYELAKLVRKAYQSVVGKISWYDGMKNVVRYKGPWQTTEIWGSKEEKQAKANALMARMREAVPELPMPSKDTWYVRATKPAPEGYRICKGSGEPIENIRTYLCAYVVWSEEERKAYRASRRR